MRIISKAVQLVNIGCKETLFKGVMPFMIYIPKISTPYIITSTSEKKN